MLAHMTCIETGLQCIVCIGCDDGTADYIFVPNWIMSRLGLSVADMDNYASLYPCLDELPTAAKITVRIELLLLLLLIRL